MAKMLSYEWLFVSYQIHFMHLLNDHKIVLFILCDELHYLICYFFFLGGYPLYWIFSPLEVIIQIVNSWHSRGTNKPERTTSVCTQDSMCMSAHLHLSEYLTHTWACSQASLFMLNPFLSFFAPPFFFCIYYF